VLGFAPLSSVALGSLPSVGGNPATALGPTANFGTPAAGYDQTQEASGFLTTAFSTPTFGTTVVASSIRTTLFGAPPLFGPTTLQISGNGSDAETTFFDVSPYYAPVTRNGSIAKSTTQSRYGTGSIRLTGASTANNLQVSGPAGRFNIAGKQFTIEAQVYLNAYNANGGRLLAAGGGGSSWTVVNGIHWLLQTNASGVEFQWLWYGLQGGYWNHYTQSISAPISLSTWQHIEVTCGPNGTVRLFVEGALIASLAAKPPVIYSGGGNTPSVALGNIPGVAASATNAADAYIQHIRIRNDARHTAAFTAPTDVLPSWIGETPSKAITTQVPSPRGIRVQPVSGFAPVQFGTGEGIKKQRPTGFTSTQFGDHRLFPYHNVPFQSTTFGTGRLFPFHVAPGFRPNFGAVAGHQYWRTPSFGPIPRFGTPTTPTDRVQVASGSRRTAFGTPFSGTVSYSGLDRTCQAFGWRATAHGGHAAGWLHTGVASALYTTAIGVPLSVSRAGAAGFSTLVFGLPAAAGNQHSAGWLASMFGTPASMVLLPATHKTTVTRFGTPAGFDPNARRAYPIRTIRHGRPTGFSRFNYGAVGFACPNFGAHAVYDTHRARFIGSGTAFGSPRLSRSNQC